MERRSALGRGSGSSLAGVRRIKAMVRAEEWELVGGNWKEGCHGGASKLVVGSRGLGAHWQEWEG